MPGQNIGLTMPNGFPGSYTRQPDMIVDTHPLGGSANVEFGTPLVYSGNTVVPFGAADTAAKFVGIAAREIKSALGYLDQNKGEFAPDEAVPTFKRGCINVLCNVGTPALNGDVYIRIAANASIPTGVIGGFEAAADGTNTVKLTNCKWHGAADANRVAEIRILTCNNA